MPNLMQKIKHEVKTARNLLYHRLYVNPQLEKNIVDQFHKLYYDAGKLGETWRKTYWLGARASKCPLDLWIYQEIMFEHKPDFIIECGTAEGGSALYLASLCDLFNHGQVITIDIEERGVLPQHKRITYLRGSSTSSEIVSQVTKLINGSKNVLVILDSDHHKEHVLNELALYNAFVPCGGYLIVEDTNINGHPVDPDYVPGPMEAVEEFLKGTQDFVVDKSREKFYLTFNPKGYLKRVR